MTASKLQALHDAIEAALFDVQDVPVSATFEGSPRVKALIATKLEEALLWTKRAMELEG